MSNIQPNIQFERPDPVLTSKIVTLLKSHGVFDQFRRECLADVDTKPAYLNLRQRVEGSVSKFLRENPWKPDMNKNQMRENLRRHIQRGGFLDSGLDRIVDQVVNPRIYSDILPKVEEVVQSCLEMDKDNKPKFVAPAKAEDTPKPLSVRQRFNLAPSAGLTSPVSVLGPRVPSVPKVEEVKPPDPIQAVKGQDSPTEHKLETASLKQEKKTNGSFISDDEEDDDEESPAFELHSENDRMILGVRSDSSENSEIIVERIEGILESENYESDEKEEIRYAEVEDNYNKERRIEQVENEEIECRNKRGGNDFGSKKSEECFEKETPKKSDSSQEDEDSSSDEYVPKTHTINMESSDGTVMELNSISPYKKFNEDSFGNVEEVVESQWAGDSSRQMKEGVSEVSLPEGSRKRKLNTDSFDDPSNSSIDKESSSDEGKYNAISTFQKGKLECEESSGDERKVGTSYTAEPKKSKVEESSSDEGRYDTVFDPEQKRLKVEESSGDEGKYDTTFFTKQKKVKVEESSSDEGKYDTAFVTSQNKLKVEESSSDEGKYHTAGTEHSKLKLEVKSEYETENEHGLSSLENEDSNMSYQESKNVHCVNLKQDSEKNKNRNRSPKSSSKSQHHRSKDHHKDRKGSSSHHSIISKDKVVEKGHIEGSTSNHSSRSKKDEKHESSRGHSKDKERKKSESSSRHHDSHGRNKQEKNQDEKPGEKNRSDKHDTIKKEKDETGKGKKDSKHNHHEKRSKSHHDKEKPHNENHSHEKVFHGKSDISTRHDKDKKDSSKSSNHSHSSTKHSHKSSDKSKSTKEDKHRQSSAKSKDSEKKFENEKHESKKKHKDQCKSSEREERRRSSDRDSNGPSSRSHSSNTPTSRSSSSKENAGTFVDVGEKTSNSDDNVSDHVEAPTEDNLKEISSSLFKEESSSLPNRSINSSDEMESDKSLCDKNQTNISSFERLEVENDVSAGCDQSERSEILNSEIIIGKNAISLSEVSETNLVESEEKSDCGENKPVESRPISPIDFGTNTSEIHSLRLEKCDSVAGSSSHDTTSEKENCEISVNNQSRCGGVLENEDEKLVKFKKPKIAKNMHELKKIMAARRNFKRVQEEKLKHQTNHSVQNSLETFENVNQKPVKESSGESEEDGFIGFENSFSDKTEKYDYLIKSLESEVKSLESIDVNPVIITSWIDFNPKFDDYIENVLKIKVHRKLIVHVPPISEEHYRFIPEYNAYELLDNEYVSPSLPVEEVVNLSSSNPAFESKENLNETNTSSNSTHRATFNGGNLKSNCHNSKTISVPKMGCKSLSPEDGKTNLKNKSPEGQTSLPKSEDSMLKNTNTSPVIGKPKPMISVTFNKTYDEILKGIEESPIEKLHPLTPQTVVKITSSCRSNEQVVVKAIQPSDQKASKVPRITKSETSVNGKISPPSNQKNKFPLISRISKISPNKICASSVTDSSPKLSGSLSPDKISNSEEESPNGMTAEVISNVVGIQMNSTSQGSTTIRSTPPKEQKTPRKGRQINAKSVTQRYDATDLYKPRPVVSGRRGRGRPPLVTENLPSNTVVTRKRVASSEATKPVKRRR